MRAFLHGWRSDKKGVADVGVRLYMDVPIHRWVAWECGYWTWTGGSDATCGHARQRVSVRLLVTWQDGEVRGYLPGGEQLGNLGGGMADREVEEEMMRELSQRKQARLNKEGTI